MAAVEYSRNSPYYYTGTFGQFLDIAKFPVVPKIADDVLFTVNKTYQYRPDLLAYDLYGDAGYWWVFALRNPDAIADPIFDMRVGKNIFLPKKDTLHSLTLPQ